MSKYSTATIDARAGGGPVSTFDLEGLTLSDLYAQAREAFGDVDADEDGETDPNAPPSNVTWLNPQGFAIHLFDATYRHRDFCLPADSFDDILEKWNDETDEDRREAMGEYLEDMGADDLSDFDEAYQGQFDSGAAFAEHSCDDLIPDKVPNWMVIDWEAAWERNLRHDYHITSGGHVFRNL